MEKPETDFERAEYLQNLLVSRATGGIADNADYKDLREYFLNNFGSRLQIPSWLKTNRNLDQFWQFIKHKFPFYAERRTFIWAEFEPLLEVLTSRQKVPADDMVSEVLKRFNADSVHVVWEKALDRRQSDTEGAITAARTLLEIVCKHILTQLVTIIA